MANLRNHLVIISSLGMASDGSCSGSGLLYTVTYDTGGDASAVDVGDYAYVEKREVGAGATSTVLSTYVYVITAISDDGVNGETSGAPVMTLKYLYDTADTGDDSPCDLPNGDGSSGSPVQADHKIVRILGSAYEMFVE